MIQDLEVKSISEQLLPESASVIVPTVGSVRTREQSQSQVSAKATKATSIMTHSTVLRNGSIKDYVLAM